MEAWIPGIHSASSTTRPPFMSLAQTHAPDRYLPYDTRSCSCRSLARGVSNSNCITIFTCFDGRNKQPLAGLFAVKDFCSLASDKPLFFIYVSRFCPGEKMPFSYLAQPIAVICMQADPRTPVLFNGLMLRYAVMWHGTWVRRIDPLMILRGHHVL